MLLPVSQHGEVVLQLHPPLKASTFHLVSADIMWPDGGTSQGWGRDGHAYLARAKAISEAVERQAHAKLPKTARLATGLQLARRIHPHRLMKYRDSQYRDSTFPFARFSLDQDRWWLSASPAQDGPTVSVLADCICSATAFDDEYRQHLYTAACTSGFAAHQTLDAAIERATLELVERDAFMRHWIAQSPGEPVAIETLPAWASARLKTLLSAGCDAGVQALTLGSHAVWLAWSQHTGLAFTSIGAAAGFSAEDALATALGEMETQALARLEGLAPQLISPQDVRSPADHAALYATSEYFRRADAVLFARRPESRFADLAPCFSIEPSELYRRLREDGHPVYWLDFTDQGTAGMLGEAPVSTVRAIAPGLIPMAFGSGLLPLGMCSDVHPDSRFPHPFC